MYVRSSKSRRSGRGFWEVNRVTGARKVLLVRWLVYQTLVSIQAKRNGPGTRRAVAISILSWMQWPFIALLYPLGVTAELWPRVDLSTLRAIAIPSLLLLWMVNALFVFPKAEVISLDERIGELPEWIAELGGPLTILGAALALGVTIAGRRILVG
jgi:hypothetical protein